MENGGIVNKLGTYQIAVVAKALKKPFYVAVESYKFSRMYPLNQRDAAEMCRIYVTHAAVASVDAVAAATTLHHPTIDFTPAEYITLLFTDLGVLTPAAVSDELIKLYQ
jgi:translation initiation factor eIF-2B subunit alpha